MKKISLLVVSLLSSSLLANENYNDFFLGLSYSDRTNGQIDVITDLHVDYDTSKYTKLEMSKKLSDTFEIGGFANFDQEKNNLLGYALSFVNNQWFITVEQSKLSGKFKDDQGTVFDKFSDNKYFDLKILQSSQQEISIGFQYLQYERPGGIELNNVKYYDPAMNTKFIGFVFELDSVKNNLKSNTINSKNDWYFYNTTALGLGNIELSENTKLLATKTISKPSEDNWTGFGLNGEYELGYVRYEKFGHLNSAFKIGLYGSAEAPVMFHSKSFSTDTSNSYPDQQFFTYGINFSLLASF